MKHFYRYLPLSDEVRTRGLYVIAGGYTLIPPQTPYPPLTHPADHDFRWRLGRTLQEYQLIYITRGGGMFESRSRGLCRIVAGDLFMLFPGEWHRYSPDVATGWDEYWVAFQGERTAQHAAEFSLSRAEPVLHSHVDAAVIEEFLHIAEEMRREEVEYQRIIAARTLLILALSTASSLRRNFAGTDILRVIEKAKCLLLGQADQPVNMEALAGSLGVGYSWFRRMFREYTGLSPAQYHLQLRLNRASELLRTTTFPIGVISQKAGFESAYYFARIFREKTGYSPREYRAMSQTPSTAVSEA